MYHASMCTHKVTGKTACHCAACHADFGSPSAFDWHQRMFPPYGLVCLAPDKVFRRNGERVLHQDPQGRWRESRPDMAPLAVTFRS